MIARSTPLERVSALWAPAGVAGVAGLLACVLAWAIAPREFYFGFLAGWLVWLGVPLGCGALLMMWRLTGGRWGAVLRPLLEPGVLTVPLFAVLFVPIALGLANLYPWADSAQLAHSEELQRKAGYLNAPFFLVRAAAFFAVWTVGGWLLLRGRLLSALGLIVYALTVTFAAIDWIGSLEPRWYTSILGLYLLVSQCLTALALMIVLAAWLDERVPAELAGGNETFLDLGNLLLTLVVLRTYLAFSQFFIIWNGNLPGEISWYIPRVRGGWGALAVVLMVIQFALPFGALLVRAAKERPRWLVAVASVVLVGQALDSAWMVLPSAPSAAGSVLCACAATAGIGGCWLAALSWACGRRARVFAVAFGKGSGG